MEVTLSIFALGFTFGVGMYLGAYFERRAWDRLVREGRLYTGGQ